MNPNVTAILQTIENFLRLASPEERAELMFELRSLVFNRYKDFLKRHPYEKRPGVVPAQSRYTVSGYGFDSEHND